MSDLTQEQQAETPVAGVCNTERLAQAIESMRRAGAPVDTPGGREKAREIVTQIYGDLAPCRTPDVEPLALGPSPGRG